MKRSIKFKLNIKLFYITTLFFLSCQKDVDMIVYNAKVYTVNENFEVASSFAVKNGKFYDIGGDEILAKYHSKNILNLDGKVVLPGLIDAHCHFYGLGQKQQVIDLVGTNSFDEIIKKLTPNRNGKSIIRGSGWDQNDWTNKEFPTKKKLDEFFPNTPVVLERIDGHAYLVNQVVLDMANINFETDSKSGSLVKINGELTGILIDGPMRLVDKVLPEPSTADQIKALLDAQKICLKNGLTTIDDAGLSKDILLLIDSLHKSKDLKIRVYGMISNESESVNYFLEKGHLKTEHLNIRSVKVYGDGALGSRGATLKQPYTDDIHNYGKLVTDPDEIIELAKKLANANFQMNTHAIGDSTIKILIDAYKKVLIDKKDPRWRIEHSQIVDLDDIIGYDNKILPSVQPTHATSDMYWAEDRIGNKRIKGAYPYKMLLNKSKIIGLGTDFPVEKVNPFHTFYAATSRKDLNGFPEDGFQNQNALTRKETLRGMTIWAAYLNFEEKEKGSIEKDKFADFVVIDRDIMEIDLEETPYSKVYETYISGELVYSNTQSN